MLLRIFRISECNTMSTFHGMQNISPWSCVGSKENMHFHCTPRAVLAVTSIEQPPVFKGQYSAIFLIEKLTIY